MVGGVASPSGSCLWHVVGLDCSVHEWAMRHGWNGRPIAQTQGQGILIGALGVLAAHYGLARHSAASTPTERTLERT